jgi:hypothetical protein
MQGDAAVAGLSGPPLGLGHEAPADPLALDVLTDDELADICVSLAAEVLGRRDRHESDDPVSRDAYLATAAPSGSVVPSSQPRVADATAPGSRHGATPIVRRGASSITPSRSAGSNERISIGLLNSATVALRRRQ